MVTLRVQQIGLIAPFGTPSWMGYILRIGDRRNPTVFRDWIWNKGGGSASLDPPYSSFQSLITKFPDYIESNICRCYSQPGVILIEICQFIPTLYKNDLLISFNWFKLL